MSSQAAESSAVVSPFIRPEWDTPLDAAERLKCVPEAATVKGMFFSSAVEIARKKNPRTAESVGRSYYISFKDYPLVEHIRVLEMCGRIGFPGASPRQGIRLLGRAAFNAFADSMVGKTVFSIAGRNWDAILKLVPRAYSITGPVGTAALIENTPAHAVIAFRQIWNFPDSYQIGILEAAMQHFAKSGEIWVRNISMCDADIEVRLE